MSPVPRVESGRQNPGNHCCWGDKAMPAAGLAHVSPGDSSPALEARSGMAPTYIPPPTGQFWGGWRFQLRGKISQWIQLLRKALCLRPGLLEPSPAPAIEGNGILYSD